MTTYTAKPAKAEIETVEDLLEAFPDDHITDTDPQADNNARASFAALAVTAYAKRTCPSGGEEIETIIGDLLGDLMHLCDGLDLSFDALVDRAFRHYDPETRGEF